MSMVVCIDHGQSVLFLFLTKKIIFMDNSDGNPLVSLLRERLKQSIGNVQLINIVVNNYTMIFIAPVNNINCTGKEGRHG